MATSDPATGPGDATVPWAGNRSMRGTQSSESESPRNDRPDARAVVVFSAPDACQEKEHASVDQTNAANLAIATLNLPVFNSFPYLITRLAPAFYHIILPANRRPKTYTQDMRERQPDRPWITWSTWELRNMAGALKMIRWLNTSDEEQQLAEVERELSVRQKVKQ